MKAERFPHQAAVYEYAEQHGLGYVWEGTPEFEKRKQYMPPDQYQIIAVHTRRGVTQVMLFSKDILKAER